MCGIVAMAGKIDPTLLSSMTASLAHRGPDGEGTWVSANGQIALGHRRLAIIDLTDAAGQPMSDLVLGYTITFNGEIYNFRELRTRLEAMGHKFRSESDTEVLLHHFAEFGIEGLRQLRGMFAFAIVHEKSGTMWCVRDRFGIKPLYYSVNKDRVAAASEVRTLLRDPMTDRSINSDAAFLTVKHLWTPTPMTLVSSIRKLEPGHVLTISGGRIVKNERYWNVLAGNEPVVKRSKSELVSNIRELLKQAVNRQMVSDVPVGAFLSGGLDSSSIVSSASSASNFRYAYCTHVDSAELKDEGFVDDLPYARLVAQNLGVELAEVVWDGSIDSILNNLILQSDEVHADPACWLTYLIAKQARNDGVKVLLSGTGGDDVFTGYRRHLALAWSPLTATLPVAVGKIATRATSHFSNSHALGNRLRRAGRNIGRDTSWQVDDAFSWLQDQHNPVATQSDLTSPVLQTFLDSPISSDFMQRVLRVEQLHFLSDHNLAYTDTHSMAAGVEARVPFLDDDLVDYVATIPQSQLMSKGKTKVLFTEAMTGVVPSQILHRPKSGFGSAIRAQMRKLDSELLRELLSPTVVEKRGVFDAARVDSLVEMNRSGHVDGNYSILAIAMIELYARTHLDR